MNHIEFRRQVLGGQLDTDDGGKRSAARYAARSAMQQFLDLSAPSLRRWADAWQHASFVNAYTLEDMAVVGEVSASLCHAAYNLPNMGRIVSTRLQQSESWRTEHGIVTPGPRRVRVER
jgi:hypothetical protein